jgi:hypothetical protein
MNGHWPFYGRRIGRGAKGQSNPLGILPAADGEKESDAPPLSAFFPKVHFAFVLCELHFKMTSNQNVWQFFYFFVNKEFLIFLESLFFKILIRKSILHL